MNEIVNVTEGMETGVLHDSGCLLLSRIGPF
jgi:hypothetical protein